VVGDDGVEVVVTGDLQRRLLAALLLRHGQVVVADVLVETVWCGLEAPLGAAALQSLVFRLRQRIPGLDLQHRGAGYVLRVDGEALDTHRFERSVWDAVAQRGDRPETALALLEAALGLWRGRPYDDLVDDADARIETERLVELGNRAREERFDLLVELGRAADVLADLESFVAGEPLRETPRRTLMNAYAATGRRADALRVYDAYRRLLADELGVAPSPELRRRHDELLNEDGVPADAAPQRDLRASDQARSLMQLRRPTSSFIGRGDAIDEVIARIGSSRLVTLIGPGGVGKTRLALESAHRLATTFTDGVVFCDLTAATPRNDAMPAAAPAPTVAAVVVAALGVEGRVDQDDLHRLSDVLRHDHTLLILDNCEHVLDDTAELVEYVLGLTDGIIVLATSRERLAVDGEHLVAVPPLAYSAGDPVSPAMQLLVERAHAVTSLQLAPSDFEMLDELCRRLDGLPLAIELAAARLQTLAVGEVIAGLDQSLSVLRGGRRTVERHRSVEAALRWSYDLLGGDERRALRAAAVFSATFDADDVAAVMDVDPAVARDLLSVLVERSMAARDGQRTFLLDIVRSFAREQTDVTEPELLRPRFASRMAMHARNMAAAVRTAADAAPVEEFRRRINDFRQAIAVALDDGDHGLALRIIVDSYEMSVTTLTPELMRWGAPAAVAGELAGHPLTADSYAVAAMGAWKRGDLDEMRALLVRCEAAVRTLGTDDRYLVLGVLAIEDLAHGRLASAIERLRDALECVEATGDPLREADTRATIAICMSYNHDPGAIEFADRLVADFSDRGGAISRAWCWYAAGEVRVDADPIEARNFLDRAIRSARLGGSSFVEGIAGASLASIQVRLDDYPAAIAAYRWLLPLWLRAGVRSPFWTAMRSVVDLLARVGEDETAARLLGAVTAPGSGHDVFGDDAERLDAIRTTLVERLGSTAFGELCSAGATLDDVAATHEATTAFDRVG
jgi:predicted ATPase/DNA-binding SARP family transcriptional activator